MDGLQLADVSLFRGCTRRELRRIASLLEEVSFEPGDVIIREANLGAQAFIVLSGRALAFRDGRQLASFSAGDLFGEVALVAGPLRTASVVAVTPVRCLAIDHIAAHELARRVPVVWERVARAAAPRGRHDLWFAPAV